MILPCKCNVLLLKSNTRSDKYFGQAALFTFFKLSPAFSSSFSLCALHDSDAGRNVFRPAERHFPAGEKSACPCPAIKVRSKRDLCDVADGVQDVFVSAVSGEGLEKLKQLMQRAALPQGALNSAFIIEERHFEALTRAASALASAEEGIGVFPTDIVSVDIKEAWDVLGEITGETATEEIINTIFSKFCVGK